MRSSQDLEIEDVSTDASHLMPQEPAAPPPSSSRRNKDWAFRSSWAGALLSCTRENYAASLERWEGLVSNTWGMICSVCVDEWVAVVVEPRVQLNFLKNDSISGRKFLKWTRRDISTFTIKRALIHCISKQTVKRKEGQGWSGVGNSLNTI